MTGAPVPIGADRVVAGGASPTAGGAQSPAAGGRRPAKPSAAAPRSCAPASELLPAGTPLCRPAPWPCSPPTATPGCRCTAGRASRCSPPATRWCRPTHDPRPGQLRDSHTDFLLRPGSRLGLAFASLGIARDDPEELRRGASRAASARRPAPALRRRLDGRVRLRSPVRSRGSAARPLFARRRASSPASRWSPPAHAGGRSGLRPARQPGLGDGRFWLFVRPLLRRWLGRPTASGRTPFPARSARRSAPAKRRDRFLPATWRLAAAGRSSPAVSPQGSHDLLAFGRATALLRVRPAPPRPPPAPPARCCPRRLAEWRQTKLPPTRRRMHWRKRMGIEPTPVAATGAGLRF